MLLRSNMRLRIDGVHPSRQHPHRMLSGRGAQIEWNRQLLVGLSIYHQSKPNVHQHSFWDLYWIASVCTDSAWLIKWSTVESMRFSLVDLPSSSWPTPKSNFSQHPNSPMYKSSFPLTTAMLIISTQPCANKSTSHNQRGFTAKPQISINVHKDCKNTQE